MNDSSHTPDVACELRTELARVRAERDDALAFAHHALGVGLAECEALREAEDRWWRAWRNAQEVVQEALAVAERRRDALGTVHAMLAALRAENDGLLAALRGCTEPPTDEELQRYHGWRAWPASGDLVPDGMTPRMAAAVRDLDREVGRTRQWWALGPTGEVLVRAPAPRPPRATTEAPPFFVVPTAAAGGECEMAALLTFALAALAGGHRPEAAQMLRRALAALDAPPLLARVEIQSQNAQIEQRRAALLDDWQRSANACAACEARRPAWREPRVVNAYCDEHRKLYFEIVDGTSAMESAHR